MGFAAGDHDFGGRLACRGAQPVDEAVGAGVEMHLVQGGGATRSDRCMVRAQALRILLGADDRHADRARHVGQQHGVGEHRLVAVDHRQQAALVVDQNEGGAGSVE